MTASPILSDAVEAARGLLGYKLIHTTDQGATAGYIVETEAYLSDDQASHSYRGLTKRNGSLFGPAGTIYVYFTYGMHYCMNIVTGPKDYGQAVLIRALEPVGGVQIMEKRRGTTDLLALTSGPAKLTQAMGIDRSVDGTNLKNGPISLERGFNPKEIVVDKRIGIRLSVDKPWRFYVKNNPYVSKVSASPLKTIVVKPVVRPDLPLA